MDQHLTMRIVSWLLVLMTVSSGAVQAPVACFERNGRVTIETDCPPGHCEPVHLTTQGSTEDCRQCVDLPLWVYVSELKPAVKPEMTVIGPVNPDPGIPSPAEAGAEPDLFIFPQPTVLPSHWHLQRSITSVQLLL
jgi:hypothetical protein